MIKLMHIVEAFGGGVFSFLINLINHTEPCYEITVLHGLREETELNFKEYFMPEVNFIKINNFTKEINVFKDFKALQEISKLIKKIKPDIIHLHSSKAGILGRIAAMKSIYNPHGFAFLNSELSLLKKTIYKTIEKLAIKRPCIITGCSRSEFNEAKKLGGEVILINNGIDIYQIDRIVNQLSKRIFNRHCLKFYTCGRIESIKNPILFNNIALSFPNNEFLWIGDGNMRGLLTSPNIKITGWKKKPDVYQIAYEQDVLIMTSLCEAMPLSLLEGMYMRKICIVSETLGHIDVINHGVNGFLCNNLDDYKAIINNIIETDETLIKKITKNAYLDIVNKLNVNNMASEYMALYNSILV